MFRIRTALAALAVTVLAGVTSAGPAAAITGGEPDGNDHPNVALILFYDATGRYRCTATLISPTVLITAAHCTSGDIGKVLVDFDSVITETGPSPYPAAADPTAGYTAAEIASMGELSGTAYAHPDYSDFTDVRNWNDVGVIVLDKPVDIAPATLAPQDYLDQFTPKVLNKTAFDVVGYGTEVRQAESGPQKPEPMSYPMIRRQTSVIGQKLTPQILQVNGNVNDPRAGGGTCFGDSGGPILHDGVIVGVTSYGYTKNCRYLAGFQRVDIEGVQSWVSSFIS
ncbi:S1 family peptidase [Aeromicrobium ginsengisoli]|uniref:Trypsin-like serine protease n=1 Tax=Aeromicrobium ginsengisoli TaxID=363867 RepID=A0A5M4FBL4_9ACTN|nr:trypsin-like serine protease [Aeromicrobium ginsengisoli]KAA1395639.1 trypsin-like serine protease [Aeromicrobium ginsengisoli]